MAATIHRSMSWRALLWSTVLSMIAWGFEGVGFALCLKGLAVEGVGLWPALSVYCISTFAGALRFLPGGIGLTEASMTGILVALGLSGVHASAATVLTRVATLWWGVLVGWTSLLSRPALVRRVFMSPADAEAAAPS
jgi:uncharacterized protein (TIRG00374 family)